MLQRVCHLVDGVWGRQPHGVDRLLIGDRDALLGDHLKMRPKPTGERLRRVCPRRSSSRRDPLLWTAMTPSLRDRADSRDRCAPAMLWRWMRRSRPACRRARPPRSRRGAIPEGKPYASCVLVDACLGDAVDDALRISPFSASAERPSLGASTSASMMIPSSTMTIATHGTGLIAMRLRRRSPSSPWACPGAKLIQSSSRSSAYAAARQRSRRHRVLVPPGCSRRLRDAHRRASAEWRSAAVQRDLAEHALQGGGEMAVDARGQVVRGPDHGLERIVDEDRPALSVRSSRALRPSACDRMRVR